jgi:SAM-dependent methyltransferase
LSAPPSLPLPAAKRTDIRSGARGFLSRFITFNKSLCRGVEAGLPLAFRINLHRRYEALAGKEVNARAGQVVVDIGGGRHCPYRSFIRDPDRQRLISIDCSEREIARNADVRLRVVADVVRSIPAAPRSIDILSSRSVLEHLEDVPAYLANCAEVLSEDGRIVHSCPCRFSPFALINRLLPDALARVLLYTFQPQWQDTCGFKAHYDHCYYSGLKAALERNGFELAHIEFRYYQAVYFDFFFPLYLVMTGYDLLMHALRIRNASCQMLFVARRRR